MFLSQESKSESVMVFCYPFGTSSGDLMGAPTATVFIVPSGVQPFLDGRVLGFLQAGIREQMAGNPCGTLDLWKEVKFESTVKLQSFGFP